MRVTKRLYDGPGIIGRKIVDEHDFVLTPGGSHCVFNGGHERVKTVFATIDGDDYRQVGPQRLIAHVHLVHHSQSYSSCRTQNKRQGLSRALKVLGNPADDAHLFLLGDVVIEGEPEEPRAQVFRKWQVAFVVAEPLAHRRCVQRHVVEYRLDMVLFEMGHQPVARLRLVEQNVKEVIVDLAPSRDGRDSKLSALLKWREVILIKL